MLFQSDLISWNFASVLSEGFLMRAFIVLFFWYCFICRQALVQSLLFFSEHSFFIFQCLLGLAVPIECFCLFLVCLFLFEDWCRACPWSACTAIIWFLFNFFIICLLLVCCLLLASLLEDPAGPFASGPRSAGFLLFVSLLARIRRRVESDVKGKEG
jgi:hypothetical protein